MSHGIGFGFRKLWFIANLHTFLESNCIIYQCFIYLIVDGGSFSQQTCIECLTVWNALNVRGHIVAYPPSCSYKMGFRKQSDNALDNSNGTHVSDVPKMCIDGISIKLLNRYWWEGDRDLNPPMNIPNWKRNSAIEQSRAAKQQPLRESVDLTLAKSQNAFIRTLTRWNKSL